MEYSEGIIWSDAFSIGNDQIDKDHQQIIEILNKLIELNQKKINQKKFAEILWMMTEYSIHHFKKEEDYMLKLNYPKIKGHKVQHSHYINEVSVYSNEFSNSNPPDINEIIGFLEKWWLSHIQNTDAEYENFKVKNGLVAIY